MVSLPRRCDWPAAPAGTVLVVVIIVAPVCWVRLVPTFIRITRFILSLWLGEVHVGFSPAVSGGYSRAVRGLLVAVASPVAEHGL